MEDKTYNLKIRNFVVISHVDHGKSTLADRFLEITGTIPAKKLREQFLDQMDLERERGITIKMTPVRMIYKIKNSKFEFRNPKPEILNPKSEIRNNQASRGLEQEFILNLIDTPGHVDFSYEVSRALAAVEGAVLLVDGTQGIQAQTLANLYLAKEQNLTIIGAINKIDLPIFHIEELADEIANLLGQDKDAILKISAKTGQNVEKLLDEIVRRIPPPSYKNSGILQALIFDSHYDPFQGVVAHVRVKQGQIKKGDKLYLISAKCNFEALDVGWFRPQMSPAPKLEAGEIGYIITGIKEPGIIRVGDTIIESNYAKNIADISSLKLPGYREPKPLIFAGFYPTTETRFEGLKDALLKLRLNDSALTFVEERHSALKKGFRLGFLGSLHMEIVKERIVREYGIDVLVTLPSVRYRVLMKDGKIKEIENPQELPQENHIKEIQEPWVKGEIITPAVYLGKILELIQICRGVTNLIENLEMDRLLIKFESPLADLVIGFYDSLKSISQGYASVAYELSDWRKGELVKLDILINGKIVEELSMIVPKERAEKIGRKTIQKLKELIPRELFPIPLQAALGGRIIARETIPALRKNVTAHLYGGDRTRKMKLWKKQKEGKKRLAEISELNIEPKVFFNLIKWQAESK
jgi:GTP-binding protein LepA